ncbi:Uncharacterised protein [Klebsiella oxytoca]|nr:Uncharacterised protein [Klebsiella oxytoca]
MGKQSVGVDDEVIDLQSISENLRALGITTLFTSLVDSAGVIRGKSVPVNRLKTLCSPQGQPEHAFNDQNGGDGEIIIALRSSP